MTTLYVIFIELRQKTEKTLQLAFEVKSFNYKEVLTKDHYLPSFQYNLEIKEKKPNIHGFYNKVFQFFWKLEK